MLCCRNSFYAYRKFTLAILDGMLSGKGRGDTVTISHEGRPYSLEVSKVPNVAGLSYKMYFPCPGCGKRARLNYGIRQRIGLNLPCRKMYWHVVKWRQTRCNEILGHARDVDGLYGNVSGNETMDLQRKLALKVDGIAGYNSIQAAFNKKWKQGGSNS